MSFTYDLTTDIGIVRLLIADTEEDDCDFSDEEVQAALDAKSDNTHFAGAMLLRALASNRARLARSVKRGAVSEDLTKIADELRKSADALQKDGEFDLDVPAEAAISPSVDSYAYTKNLLLGRDGSVREAP
jgi:hypothetical protein